MHNFTTAHYTEQRIPQYRNNPLIEALPPLEKEDQLIRSLFRLPAFDKEQREWDTVERKQMIGQLASFMLPMQRHIILAQTLDTLIRQGYMGRQPRSAQFHGKFEHLYEMQKAGKSFPNTGAVTAQLSAAFLGLPGMGKTKSIEHILSRYPDVIFHPEINIYQVPCIKIETPYDGASVKGLAQSIIRKLDVLFPDANYGKQYGNSKAGAETLMNHAARLLHAHLVGLLVVDEVQNLENSPKNRQAMMTLLVSASNELGVPILFVGTNKAKNILTLDFRQARRSTGVASSYWGPLIKGGHDTPSEWEDFIKILWQFQWVRHPIELTSSLSELMFHHSQGIVDIAIKLFALSQLRAMHNESEALSAQLIEEVAREDMQFVQPMLSAIRTQNHKLLEQYQDIAPLGLESLMGTIDATYSGHTIRAAVTLPGNDNFHETITSNLEGLGFKHKDAEQLATSVSDAPSALVGVARALKLSTSGRKHRGKPTEISTSISYPAGDYRNGVNPTISGENNYTRLKTLGLLPNLKAILHI